MRSAPPATTNKWIFTSYQRDSESGLDYALARYYDSRTGTFCSADPLAGDPSDPQSWNRYPYGRNDPIDMTDPTGKSFGDFVGSLINGLFDGLAFTFGGPAGIAWSEANSYAYYGKPYLPGGGFGGTALGSSWNGTPIMPYPGLTNGLQTALGLPTMADVGPLFNAQNGSALTTQSPIYCQPDVIAAMKTIWGQSSNGTSRAEASFRLDGSPANYNIVVSPFTNERDKQKLTIKPGTTFALFHVHPNSSDWQPSTPGNNAEGNPYGDTGVADKYNLQMYVVSSKGLGFYDPATKKPSVQLRPGLDWTKPCPQAGRSK